MPTHSIYALVDPNTGKTEKETCETIFYDGFGEEHVCGKPAVALLDNETGVCVECAQHCHHTRLTWIRS